MAERWPIRSSQGSGVDRAGLSLGERSILEGGVRIFHPETITIADDVYVGHDTILKGHPSGRMSIGSGTWIGQQCYFNSAGGIIIGSGVGIGPGVTIITSEHSASPLDAPILLTPLRYASVVIDDHADIGVRSVLLPGVRIGRGAIVGAGSVVTKDVPPNTVAAGVPARHLRNRAT